MPRYLWVAHERVNSSEGGPMDDLLTADTPVNAELPVLAERRRPGRLALVSPQLMPLLRGGRPGLTPNFAEDELDDPEQLRPVHGIGLALLCSLLLWALLGATVWVAFTSMLQSA